MIGPSEEGRLAPIFGFPAHIGLDTMRESPGAGLARGDCVLRNKTMSDIQVRAPPSLRLKMSLYSIWGFACVGTESA